MEKEIHFSDASNNGLIKNINVITEMIPPGNNFVHRVNEANEMTTRLFHILNNQRAPNFFIYGIKGTGKTALTLYKLGELKECCKDKDVQFYSTYTNCGAQGIRSEIEAISDIIKQLEPQIELPKTGVTAYYIYVTFEEILAKKKIRNLVIVLDEFDKLHKKDGDNILFYLSRLKDNPNPAFLNMNLTTIIISNESKVMKNLRDKTISSFGRDHIDFFQYDAEQLKDILDSRVQYAVNPNKIEEGVLNKIAALVAQRDGDARRALEIFGKCCALVLTRKLDKISLDLVDDAFDILEQDLFMKLVSKMSLNQKTLFLSLLIEVQRGRPYSYYAYQLNEVICQKIGRDKLDIRNLQSYLVFFEEANLIETVTKFEKSIGRKTKVISLFLDDKLQQKAKEYLLKDLGFVNEPDSPSPPGPPTPPQEQVAGNDFGDIQKEVKE